MARTGDMENRHKRIIGLLSREPVASVAQLSAALGVSKETIRKDLTILCDDGKINRIHGGAALVDTMPFQVRKTIAEDEKRVIAGAAADLLEKDDSVIIEGSTTNVLLCTELLAQPDKLRTLTIVTNSVRIALMLDLGEKCRRLYLLGGRANADEGSSYGTQTVEALKGYHTDKAFLSAAALDARLNITAYKEYDMLFQKQAVLCANKAIVLVNRKKIPSAALFHVCSLREVACVVTDAALSGAQKEELNRSGTRLIQA